MRFTFEDKCVRPKSFEIEDWLEAECKIRLEDIIGFNLSIVKPVLFVKLASSEICKRIVQSCGGKMKYKYSDGKVVEVSVVHAGFGIRTVRIFELPYEVTSEQLEEVISQYGQVTSNTAEKWSSAHKFPVLNGVRQLKVELRRHIPSYIDVCGYRAIVMYDDQPKTCGRCGGTGHVRAKCMQRRVAQLPAGEAAHPPVLTTLPVTFVAAARGQSTAHEEPDISELQEKLREELLMETNVTTDEVPPITKDILTPAVVTDAQVPGITTAEFPPLTAAAQTPMQTADALQTATSQSADTPPPVVNNQKRGPAIETTDSLLNDVEPKPGGSVDNKKGPSRGSSPTKNKIKKPRLAPQNANASVAALREKAKQIGAELRQKEFDCNSENQDHSSAGDSSQLHTDAVSGILNPQQTPDSETREVDPKANLPHAGSPTQPIRPLLGNWGAEMEIAFSADNESMDTSIHVTPTNIGSVVDVCHARVNDPTDTANSKGQTENPFATAEYF